MAWLGSYACSQLPVPQRQHTMGKENQVLLSEGSGRWRHKQQMPTARTLASYPGFTGRAELLNQC